ncbi:MAG TPA: glycosyltransferase [Anaerolineales bacterium]
MKIVAIAGSRVPSDTANSIQVMKACQALVQLGHELTLIVPANPSSIQHPPTDEIASLYGLQISFPIEWLSSFNRRLFTWQAVQRARALKPDLLYVWMVQSAVFGLLARLPVIFEIHIQPSGLLGPAWHRGFARIRGRKRLVSITRALVDVLQNQFHVLRLDADEIVIAPNGVDLERFASLPDPVTARRQLNFTESPTVMCTGHLYAGRGVELFIELARRIPSAQFVWVGGRPQDVNEWRAKASSQNLQNVLFTGFIPNRDLPLYQSAADILLMPYARSIFGSSGSADSAAVASPMKMFEYMAAERAIITSDLPVIREVLNESNAVFCPPDDVDAWKTAIENLLAYEPRRLMFARQARFAVENHTWIARARKALDGF